MPRIVYVVKKQLHTQQWNRHPDYSYEVGSWGKSLETLPVALVGPSHRTT